MSQKNGFCIASTALWREILRTAVPRTTALPQLYQPPKIQAPAADREDSVESNPSTAADWLASGGFLFAAAQNEPDRARHGQTPSERGQGSALALGPKQSRAWYQWRICGCVWVVWWIWVFWDSWDRFPQSNRWAARGGWDEGKWEGGCEVMMAWSQQQVAILDLENPSKVAACWPDGRRPATDHQPTNYWTAGLLDCCLLCCCSAALLH
ncbi:predicted protein [Histoplasma capsulatum G186AR]|uniref:Uncharacterized protein n=1 Tax=Ajellomyces capsulatus (strain G186AR / H82 / ATCC MYA-2454 / RMSCC 2432) TaxID=447093 RepID=C0NSJ4_AJECG|nr:uncharacterized protein HCBG_06124 [Histoplasma capsulatum G186AR]EEH05860.1 predicted protein [Histoplasma capsulatum G186AR]